MSARYSEMQTAWAFARRELRGGLKGFRILIACLALGVGAIASVGSLSEALQAGLAAQSLAVLGGDAEVRLTQRDLDDAERDWLFDQGTISEVKEMRVMARGLRSDSRSLVEVKAPDNLYPLYGELEFAQDTTLAEATSKVGDVWGAAVESKVLPRLGVAPGDQIRLGDIDVEVRAVVNYEPDRVSTGFMFAPRIFIAPEAFQDTGLIQPGSQIERKYRIKLPAGVDGAVWLDTARGQLKSDAAERLRGPSEGTQGAEEFIKRVSLFLTLVGLTTLIIGGLGVGNAIKAYMEGKTEVIATFKCLGATSSLIFRSFLLQVLVIASIGVAIGLLIGVITPMLVVSVVGDLLPFAPEVTVYPAPLALAAIDGFLVTVAFAVWPLARAQDIKPAALFRDIVDADTAWPRPQYVAIVVGAFGLLAVLAVLITPYRLFALIFLVGASAAFLLLRLEAFLLMRLAKAAGRPSHPGLRMALANLYRPGSTTSSMVLSVGLGLTLLVGVALIEGNISRQIEDELPNAAPSFFMLDIRRDQAEPFDELVSSLPGASQVTRQPIVRARVIKLNGVEADKGNVAAQEAWFLRGERNITYRADLPENSTIVEGEWWPSDYDGPPIVSMTEDVAYGLGLGLGDTITFSIVGREVEGTITNIRNVDVTQGGTNFNAIFAPGALEKAPQQNVALVYAKADSEEEIYNTVSDTFPNVTVVWVREALSALNTLLEDIALAVKSTGAVTLVAGVLVMAGAMASGYRNRVYESVILKVLGATRGRILASYLMEYTMLGLGTALIAAIIGTLGAWLTITEGMQASWFFLPATLVGTVLAATAVTVILGLLGTWRALSQKAAPVLRAE